jgi:hypothetical protein
MGIAPMPFDAAKWMFANSLSSFIIMWVLFDVVVIDVHCILVFASMDDAFGKFGTFVF